jgi:hypothetical protein
MDQDREHTERSTDEQLASRRHAKFGELPPPVLSDDMVETKDSGHSHEEPPEPLFRQEWGTV